MIVLTIGGIPISVEQSDAIAQTYEAIGGRGTLRTMGGGAIRQRNWSRIKTTISVSEARMLPALSALDIDTPLVIQCIAPRSIHSALPAVALPTARRADVAPYGFAVMPSGLMRRTGGTLAGNTLTLDVVPGAVSYVARYWPELTVLVMALTEHQDVRGAVAGWDLTAEEI